MYESVNKGGKLIKIFNIIKYLAYTIFIGTFNAFMLISKDVFLKQLI
jgi:hypothetical protein